MALHDERLESRVADEVPENYFSLSALDVVKLSLPNPHKPLELLRQAYLCLLAQNNYKISKVARQLEISRPTMYQYLRVLKIDVKNEKGKANNIT